MSLSAPASTEDQRAAERPRCPSCGSTAIDVFHEQDGVPVHSCRLVETLDEALAFPRGRLRLGLCNDCGFISNLAFDPSLQDYGVAYEETQGFSPRFNEFARALALRWIERYGVRGRTVLEIGCGKGEFLSLMCELGPNDGIGIDPAFVPERASGPAASRIRFIADLYDERYAHLEADVIVCRHTIEHIAPVAEFLRLVRRTIGDRHETLVLFDLPDVVRVLREGAFWDVYYEHCSYFSPGSLARLFRRTGFRVLALERDYDDQYLVLEALPDADDGSSPLPIEDQPDELAALVASFRTQFEATTRGWRRVLRAARADGDRVAVWGAGSKAVAFLTTLAADDEVAYAVDVNPYKRAKYLAGTGHLVRGPDDLLEEPPDLVVAMNAIYLPEIRATLDARGLSNTRLIGV